ncbi:hypothetical protein ACUL41_02160 [Virgibacillus natechei]|uniref:hypothetical protein n=1 Tax=Virgibacillus sp. CBA3643 TaxID=2942278 RepID=UPI0035A2793B
MSHGKWKNCACSDQAWFWSKEWQKDEREVEKQIKEGKLSEVKTLDDTITDLDKLSKK